jgi:uncharacterized protein with FMN-binding domain
MPRKRMNRGLVALSTSAIAAVYLAGYLRTSPADAAIASAAVAEPLTAAVASVAPRASTDTPQPVITVAPTPTAAAPTLAQYKDGTYAGTGSSRRGDIWVSVDVAGGRIAKVTITQSTLQFPLRDLAALPAEVVERQSAQVDIISRATYSSQAFRSAVSQALAQAVVG